MKKKGPDRAAMDQLEAQDVTSFGEDPEFARSGRAGAADGGNAGDTQPPAPPEGSEAAPPAAERAPAQRSAEEPQPPHDDQTAAGDAPSEDFSDEQVRKLAPTTRFPHGHC